MRPEETEVSRRVDIIQLVRPTMMMPMMGSPPKRALLQGSQSKYGTEKLKPP